MKLEPAKRWIGDHPDLLIVGGWTLAVIAAYLPELARGEPAPKSALWFLENALQWMPYSNFTGSMLRDGLMPTWAPQIFCGFPYYTYPATNLYHPLFYLLTSLDYVREVSLECIFSLALSGAFFYLGFRRQGFSPAAALVGMLTLAGSMYAWWVSGYGPAIRLLAAVALCFWGLCGISRGPLRFRHWLAVALGGFLLSLHAELFLYTCCFLPLLGLAVGARPPYFRRGLVLASAILAGGLGIGAEWLSLTEYMHLSVRAPGITFQYYLENKLAWTALLGLAVPLPRVYLGNYSPFYVGLSVLWLSGVALVRGGRQTVWILIGLVLALMMVLDVRPLVDLTYRLPILGSLLLHQWVFPLALVFIALLAARGAEAAIASGFPSARAWLAPALIGPALAASALSGKSWLQAGILLGLAIGAGVAIFRPALLDSRGRRAFWIAAFVAMDITFLALRGRPRTPLSEFAPFPEARALLEQAGRVRFWPLSQDFFFDNHLNANIGMRLDPLLPGTASPLGYWRTPPMRIARLINLISPGYLDFQRGKLNRVRLDRPTGPHPFGPQALPLLSLLNVEWIISNGIDLPELPGLERRPGKELLFFRNPGVLPRVRTVSRWQVAKDGAESLAAVGSGQLNFSEEAVIESRSGLVSGSAGTGPAHPVGVNSTRPGFWDLELPTGHDGQGAAASLLVVAETLMPGWRAFLDGREVPIHYAYHAFMGVMIPPGPHRVILVHRPWAFRIGIWLSLISMMAWPVLILARSFRPSAAPAQ